MLLGGSLSRKLRCSTPPECYGLGTNERQASVFFWGVGRMSDLSEYYARRFTKLRTTSDPYKITCGSCKASPRLDGMLGNMTHSGDG